MTSNSKKGLQWLYNYPHKILIPLNIYHLPANRLHVSETLSSHSTWHHDKPPGSNLCEDINCDIKNVRPATDLDKILLNFFFFTNINGDPSILKDGYQLNITYYYLLLNITLPVTFNCYFYWMLLLLNLCGWYSGRLKNNLYILSLPLWIVYGIVTKFSF